MKLRSLGGGTLMYQSGVPTYHKLFATHAVTKKAPLKSRLRLFRYNLEVLTESQRKIQPST